MILAIDTATPVSSVALGDRNGVVASQIIEGGAHHAEFLVPTIRSLCTSVGVVLPKLDSIAVDVGPGLFTGLRVGVSTAKSLGMALGIGVHAVSSLDALVQPLATGTATVVAAIDARRGEVFAAAYRLGRSPGEPVSLMEGPAVMDPEGLAILVATARSLGGPGESIPVDCSTARQVHLVGDGFRRYFPDGLPGAELIGADHPHAEAVLALASGARSPLQDPGDVLPRYLRPADVRIHWETRGPATTPTRVERKW